jgi:HEAT repeat protein
MRHPAALALLLALVTGCSKKPPEPAAAEAKPDATPADVAATERTRLLNALKGANEKARLDAIEELSARVERDPETTAALLELLKDKTNAGLGKTNPLRITSTREAAARTLLLAGPKGGAALKEKGLAALRDGLNDPQPAVREHTAHTVELLGPLAKPLSADVMKLCAHPDAPVRGAAFDALGSIGVADVPAFVVLLTHENAEIGTRAAELIPGLPEIPDAAVEPLAAALRSEVEAIRLGAAAGLTAAGPKAGKASGEVLSAIRKHYPGTYDDRKPAALGPELAYWRALARMGEAGVTPASGLLLHPNAVVRALAARSLGEIGPAAESAAQPLKGALKDEYGFVAVEAACALCRVGAGKDEAVELVKRAIDAPNNVAQLAIEAIPRMGEAGKPLVAPALEKLKSDNPFARFAAVGLVATLPPAEATKAAADVGMLATDDVPDVRQRVGFVLEQLGPAAAPAADALGKALATEKNEALRDQFVDALAAMGPGAKPAVPALLPLAADKTLPVARRERVIAAVAAADPASQAVADALVALAGESDQNIRAAAALALGRLEPLPPQALKKLVALAKTDPRTGPRAAALRALAIAGRHARTAKADIEPLARDPREDGLTLLAKVALAAMDGDATKSLAVVRAGLTDKKPDGRAAAAGALLGIGPQAEDLPALLKLLADRDADTRETAVKCLGRLGPAAKDAVGPLVKLLTNDTTEVRIAAANALGDIGPAAFPAVPKLQQVARSDRTVEPAARKALEKLGVKEGQPKK